MTTCASFATCVPSRSAEKSAIASGPGRPVPANVPMMVRDVSLIALVADATRFDGELVRVVGWAVFAFESQGIFVTREHTIASQNGVWLDLPLSAGLIELGGSNVIVEGVFDAHAHGHLSMWAAALKEIRRLQTWGGPMRDLLR